MANKTITMAVQDGNFSTALVDHLDSDSTWKAQAYLFHKFLVAQGFILDVEDVGGCTEAYVDARTTENQEI
jgi:hypothetical protein